MKGGQPYLGGGANLGGAHGADDTEGGDGGDFVCVCVGLKVGACGYSELIA